jgi:hypothetical protein
MVHRHERWYTSTPFSLVSWCSVDGSMNLSMHILSICGIHCAVQKEREKARERKRESVVCFGGGGVRVSFLAQVYIAAPVCLRHLLWLLH